MKRFERALQIGGHLQAPYNHVVPGKEARLDAYGNWSVGQMIQILSQLRITLTAGFTRNMAVTVRGKKYSQMSKEERAATNSAIAAVRRAGGRFFVVPQPTPRLRQPGIYMREDDFGNNITPIGIFVKRATYRTRLDLPYTLQRAAAEQLPREIERSIGEQLQRLMARGSGGGA
jgi:hypothetical protein